MKKLILSIALAIALAATLFIPTVPANADGGYFGNYKNTYKPDTGVQAPPAIVADVNTKEVYYSLATEKTPSVAAYYVNDELEVTDSLGIVITELSNALTLNADIIPAVKISNGAQAEAFIAFAKENVLRDAYVISPDAGLVKEICQATDGIYGVVDFTSALPGKTEIRKICAESGALIALINAADADAELITYLAARLQPVWLTCGNSKTEIFKAMNTGCRGVITANHGGAIEILESIRKVSLFGRKLIIGHRGTPNAGENTLNSALEAFGSGADAVECDIQLTADNEIVLMHDDTIDRTTNGSGRVSEMTLAQLKQFTVKKSTERIPTAREYLEGLNDVNGVIVIEYKKNNTKIVPMIKKIIYDLGMENNVVFLTSFRAPALLSRTEMPEIPLFYGANNKEAAISDAEKYNFHVHYTYTQTNEELDGFLQTRGVFINSWTYSDAKNFDAHYAAREDFLTVDVPSLGADYAASCVPVLDKFTVKTDEASPLPVVGTVLDKFQTERDTSFGILQLEGTAELIESNSNFYGSNDGYAYVALKYSSVRGYTVYSNPVAVISGNGKLPEEKPETSEESTLSPSGCSCGGDISAYAMFPAALCFAVFAVIKKHQ